jgi:hypothetical protein
MHEPLAVVYGRWASKCISGCCLTSKLADGVLVLALYLPLHRFIKRLDP